MGWNSWNFFRCNINETLIKEVADAIVATGLRDAGYKYVNIDDCWMEKRGPDGRIQPFKDKFPNGMKALADYIHERGLKFGVYSDTGNHTCEGYPGSWGHEELDAKTYAEWGVDYLKYDYCGMEKTTVSVRRSYEIMRDALNATGRPILFSLCSWGSGAPHEWGQQVGNSWRTGIDVFAVWDKEQAIKLKLPSFLQPVLTAIKQQEAYVDNAGPGGFNDPDMLVVGLEGMYPYGIVQECPEHIPGCKPGEYISRDRWGRVGGLTHTEQRTHFAFWCMLASPLILGNDPRHMSKATLQILLAREIIGISQDPLAKQAKKVYAQGDVEIWIKPLAGGRVAALLFNAGSKATDITLSFARDMPELSGKWAREVKEANECTDSLPGCPTWAKSGECKNNPGFMLNQCRRSCPEGCPHALETPGPKATALLRDAWLEEDLGAFTGKWQAHLVEPHEARVVTLQFVEPADGDKANAELRKQQREGQQGTLQQLLLQKQLSGKGVQQGGGTGDKQQGGFGSGAWGERPIISTGGSSKGDRAAARELQGSGAASLDPLVQKLQAQVTRLTSQLQSTTTEMQELSSKLKREQQRTGGAGGAGTEGVGVVTAQTSVPFTESYMAQAMLALNVVTVLLIVLLLRRGLVSGRHAKAALHMQ